MSKKLAVIGVGNMAKAIISGIRGSDIDISDFYLYDVNPDQYKKISGDEIVYAETIADAISSSDCVLLSVKPQNYPEVLDEIAKVPCSSDKLYISIGAGITVKSVCESLRTDRVVRVLPNLPMLISQGVSVICRNDDVGAEDFDLVVKIFESAGSSLIIDEKDMNKIIGVTSSSPAYVFKFIQALYDGAVAQGLSEDGLIEAICDTVIGSAQLIKNGFGTPNDMAKAVASKGGTTEKALEQLDEGGFNSTVIKAMIACTARADELGAKK